MAGEWIKIEHVMPDKPEIDELARALKIDHDAVVGKLVRLWIWADQQTIDGKAVKVSDSFLDRLTNCPGFAGGLLQVGWLASRNGRLSLPNFDRHNGQTAKSRALTKDRVKRHRNDPSVTSAHERESEKENSGSSNNPSTERSAAKPPSRARSSGVYTDISPEVLRDHRLLEKWFDHERRRRDGWVKSESDWVNVKAAAAKALSAEDVADPVALFKWLVKNRMWGNLSDANDDLAAAWRRDLERGLSDFGKLPE